MMFSTKAEYGVRVMVELARRADAEPIPLAEIAEHDGMPLAYLEHLVARLRKAGLVDSRRGSRGGYLLARSPTEITMAEVVEALEGSIAPIECISQAADGSIVCSRESTDSDPTHPMYARPSSCGRACAVRSCVRCRTLRWRTSCSDHPSASPADCLPIPAPPLCPRCPPPPRLTPPRWPTDSLLQATPDDRSPNQRHGRPRDQRPARTHRGARDPARRRPRHFARRDPRADGPERLGQVHPRQHPPRPSLL